jgi:hypothetical protein
MKSIHRCQPTQCLLRISVLAAALWISAGCGWRTNLSYGDSSTATDGAGGAKDSKNDSKNDTNTAGTSDSSADLPSANPDIGMGGSIAGSGGSSVLGSGGAGGRPDGGGDAAGGSPDGGRDAGGGSLDGGRDTGRDSSMGDLADAGRDRPSDSGFDIALDGRVDALIDGRPDVRLSDARDARVTSDTPGVLKLVAGKVGGPGKQDGVGTAAQFVGPWAVTSDGAANLFVADRSNHTIRKIAIATGTVTTLAGSPGLRGSSDGTGSCSAICLAHGRGLRRLWQLVRR